MILLVTHPEFYCLLHEILLGRMKKRTGAGFTLNLSDGPHKRGNATLRRRRGTGFADICIDFVHGWVSVSVSGDKQDHVSGIGVCVCV